MAKNNVTRSRVSANDRIRVALWMAQNVDRFRSTTISQGTEIVAKEIGVRVIGKSMRQFYQQLNIPYIRTTRSRSGKTTAPSSYKIRMLAKYIRALYRQLGEPTPGGLEDMCKGLRAGGINDGKED